MKQLKSLVKQMIGWTSVDYRAALFEELRTYLNGSHPARILEIGPKDGHDTRRLLQLKPDVLTLIDLPRMKETNESWLCEMDASSIQYISANFMYSDRMETLEPYDFIWCTGVLYHNPEQLRMVKKLYDLMKPGGVLVLESATARGSKLRHLNCVEIVYPPSEELKKQCHISKNITHLPSAQAIASWMGMVGLQNIVLSSCHSKVSRPLARTRAAFLGTKPLEPVAGTYYNLGGEEGFIIGKAR